MAPRVTLNTERLAEIAHFIIARTPPHELGATKLNKVLWWVDCAAQRTWGQSITGLTHYERKDLGPVPIGMGTAIRRLKESGKVTEQIVETPLHPRREYVSNSAPDFASITKEEIDLIHVILDQVRRMTAREASNLSHDAYWEEMPSGSSMSIAAGAMWRAEPTSDAFTWAEEELAQLGL